MSEIVVINGRYKVVGYLGNSPSALFWEVEDRDGRVYTLKRFYVSEPLVVRKAVREYEILDRLTFESEQSPFVLQLLHCFAFRNEFCLIFPKVSEFTLYNLVDIVGPIQKTEEIVFYLCELLSGLEYLQKQKIVHRAFRLENVLLKDDGHIVISGLEYSYDLARNLGLNVVYEPPFEEYLPAPEIDDYDHYDLLLDIWFLGLLVGHLIFGNDCRILSYVNLVDGYVRMPEFLKSMGTVTVERCFIDLIQNCCQYQRSGLHLHMGMAIFRDVDWDKVKRLELVPPYTAEQLRRVKTEKGEKTKLDFTDVKFLKIALKKRRPLFKDDNFSFDTDPESGDVKYFKRSKRQFRKDGMTDDNVGFLFRSFRYLYGDHPDIAMEDAGEGTAIDETDSEASSSTTPSSSSTGSTDSDLTPPVPIIIYSSSSSSSDDDNSDAPIPSTSYGPGRYTTPADAPIPSSSSSYVTAQDDETNTASNLRNAGATTAGANTDASILLVSVATTTDEVNAGVPGPSTSNTSFSSTTRATPISSTRSGHRRHCSKKPLLSEQDLAAFVYITLTLNTGEKSAGVVSTDVPTASIGSSLPAALREELKAGVLIPPTSNAPSSSNAGPALTAEIQMGTTSHAAAGTFEIHPDVAIPSLSHAANPNPGPTDSISASSRPSEITNDAVVPSASHASSSFPNAAAMTVEKDTNHNLGKEAASASTAIAEVNTGATNPTKSSFELISFERVAVTNAEISTGVNPVREVARRAEGNTGVPMPSTATATTEYFGARVATTSTPLALSSSAMSTVPTAHFNTDASRHSSLLEQSYLTMETPANAEIKTNAPISSTSLLPSFSNFSIGDQVPSTLHSQMTSTMTAQVNINAPIPSFSHVPGSFAREASTNPEINASLEAASASSTKAIIGTGTTISYHTSAASTNPYFNTVARIPSTSYSHFSSTRSAAMMTQTSDVPSYYSYAPFSQAEISPNIPLPLPRASTAPYFHSNVPANPSSHVPISFTRTAARTSQINISAPVPSISPVPSSFANVPSGHYFAREAASASAMRALVSTGVPMTSISYAPGYSTRAAATTGQKNTGAQISSTSHVPSYYSHAPFRQAEICLFSGHYKDVATRSAQLITYAPVPSSSSAPSSFAEINTYRHLDGEAASASVRTAGTNTCGPMPSSSHAPGSFAGEAVSNPNFSAVSQVPETPYSHISSQRATTMSAHANTGAQTPSTFYASFSSTGAAATTSHFNVKPPNSSSSFEIISFERVAVTNAGITTDDPMPSTSKAPSSSTRN